jgi:tetrahydromethanopterin S-methyltransferase subunit F
MPKQDIIPPGSQEDYDRTRKLLSGLSVRRMLGLLVLIGGSIAGVLFYLRFMLP